jgi:long-chain acyl-CoA synthetase
MPKLTVANLVDRAARRYGDKPFVHTEQKIVYENIGLDPDKDVYSFSDSLKATNVVAAALRDKLGVRPGDRVAVVLTNSLELGLVFTAITRLGAVFVPFNYMLKAEEITKMVNDCGAKVLITESELFALNIRDKANVPGIEHWIMVGPRDTVPAGFLSVDELAEGLSNSRVEPAELEPMQTAAIFYTSGTTGFPKGAMVTSRNMIVTTAISAYTLRLGPKDFCVTSLPLAHIFGFDVNVIGGFFTGASGMLQRFFDPEKTLHYLEKYKATLYTGVPAMYNAMLLFHPEKYDLSNMRYWIAGADAMPEDQKKIYEGFGGKFIEGYGMVETAALISVNIPLLKRAGTVGRPIPSVRVKVMDESGKMLRAGDIGEFVVKGPSVMNGYWGDEERTAEAFKYGWLHTGDMGYKDRLGFLHFVDREKDVIKVGGYSVFSREVEEEILQNPKVLEVALVGVPHPTKREVPVAVIQLVPGQTATEEELLDWCKQKIAGYKSPRAVKIIDEMPLTMTLKVLKRELRQQLIDEGFFQEDKVRAN